MGVIHDVGSYLGSIDFGLALVVTVIGAAFALAALWFLESVADDVLGVLPRIGGRLGRIVDLRDSRGPAWICLDCRSLNDPSTIWCYRGCGSRLRQRDGWIDPNGLEPLDDD
jgi:hypothetical protein